MDEDLKVLLELYEDGLKIKEIAQEMNVNTSAIMDNLLSYKESQKDKGKYSEDFQILIARRDCRGQDITRNMIMSELNISRNLLIKAIEKHGFVNNKKIEEPEEFIRQVKLNFEFTECPECLSGKINPIKTVYKGFSEVDGVYCLNCGNEFFTHGMNLFKVRWENVD